MYDSTSVRAVITTNNKLLVEWFEPLSIFFAPGGTVESGEELQLALQRELVEEIVGVELVIGRYLGEIGHIWKKSDGKRGSCLNHFFAAHIDPAANIEQIQAREPGRIIRWLDLLSSAADKLQPPSLKALIASRSAGDKTVWKVVDSEV